MKLSYVLLLTVVADPAAARTVRDDQIWFDLSASGPLSGRLMGMVQAQPRFRDKARETQQLLGRAGLGWAVSDGLTVWVAYTHTELSIDHAPDVNEERIYEQANFVLRGERREALSGRTRLEQRRRSNGSGTAWRLRQQLRYAYRLAARPAAPSLVLSVEPMAELNDTGWGARGGFDQLRSFVGLGLPVSRRMTVETGYLNQLVNLRHGDTAINHAAVLSIAYRF